MQQSSMHSYMDWAKRRIDEMDATLTSLEAKASEVKARSQSNADEMIAQLRKRRDDFEARINTNAEASEAALEQAKAQLESQWKAFEAQVTSYFETVGKQIEQQQATFRDIAAAQLETWHKAADKFRAEAKSLAAARITDIDGALKRINQQGAEAEARMQKLKHAGSESWTALSAALAESREAFDRAMQQAWAGLSRAAKS